MVRIEHNNGLGWTGCGEFCNEGMAWASLGGDDLNYRAVDVETGKVLTDKSQDGSS